ncbi:MAG: hypothetical protein A2992_02135 [Elusimicrobia bacterium RIFCSPLOWO2_01_FULL_59_12]|nr:MAG: hypothetical protein A2992_02135 [Elusimicrobia bacterium RIFCSPLOWO2_01_FULL_59_12]
MLYFISILSGLIAGSFSNVCIARLPEGKSLWFPRSHCPKCDKSLRVIDNIPVISFFLLHRRCFGCRQPISWRYPAVEAALAALFLFSAWWFQPQLARIVIFDLLVFFLLTISVIDFHHKIIPNELSFSLLGIGLAASFINPYLSGKPLSRLMESLLAATAGGALMMLFAWSGEKIFKKEALGGGDIKLMAGFGAFLGWSGLIGSLTLGSLVGAVFGSALLLLKRKRPGDAIPYGPFLCLGAFVSALLPGGWYSVLFP